MATFRYGFSARTRGRLARLCRNITKRVFTEVIDSTPVDTGQLKANWRTAAGEGVAGSLIVATDSSGSATKRAMRTIVDASIGEQDTTVSMTNSAGYANVIEYNGHSHTKAPNGMVRVNLVAVQRIIDQEQRRV